MLRCIEPVLVALKPQSSMPKPGGSALAPMRPWPFDAPQPLSPAQREEAKQQPVPRDAAARAHLPAEARLQQPARRAGAQAASAGPTAAGKKRAVGQGSAQKEDCVAKAEAQAQAAASSAVRAAAAADSCGGNAHAEGSKQASAQAGGSMQPGNADPAGALSASRAHGQALSAGGSSPAPADGAAGTASEQHSDAAAASHGNGREGHARSSADHAARMQRSRSRGIGLLATVATFLAAASALLPRPAAAGVPASRASSDYLIARQACAGLAWRVPGYAAIEALHMHGAVSDAALSEHGVPSAEQDAQTCGVGCSAELKVADVIQRQLHGTVWNGNVWIKNGPDPTFGRRADVARYRVTAGYGAHHTSARQFGKMCLMCL